MGVTKIGPGRSIFRDPDSDDGKWHVLVDWHRANGKSSSTLRSSDSYGLALEQNRLNSKNDIDFNLSDLGDHACFKNLDIPGHIFPERPPHGSKYAVTCVSGNGPMSQGFECMNRDLATFCPKEVSSPAPQPASYATIGSWATGIPAIYPAHFSLASEDFPLLLAEQVPFGPIPDAKPETSARLFPHFSSGSSERPQVTGKMATESTLGRQASGDLLSAVPRISPPRTQSFNSAATLTRISSESLPDIVHIQSSPGSPNSLASQYISTAAAAAATMFNPRHQRSVSDYGPVTYTPRTHKVSKAKKGKLVHRCEYPGCNKLFSRAEHVRRHASKHDPAAVIRCEVEGCGKTFTRKDLRVRHMENKHSDILGSRTASLRSDRHLTSSPATTASEPHGLMSPVPFHHRHASVPAVSHEANSMSIGSLVQPGTQPDFGNEYSVSVWSENESDLARGGIFSALPHVNSDDAIYSSPDSCQSPSPDVHPFRFPQHTPIMDQSFSESFYHPQLAGPSLTLASTVSDWTPLEAGATTSQMLPLSVEGDILQTPYQFQYSSPDCWTEMSGMPCDAHVLPPPVSLQEMYDSRPNAKENSLTLLEACLNLLSQRKPITIRSPISDIFTLYFYLNTSRNIDPGELMLRYLLVFKSLYGAFIQNRHLASKNPLAVFNTLSDDEMPDGLTKAALALDPFRSNLILSYVLLTNMRSTDLELSLEPFIERLRQGKTEKHHMERTEPPGSSRKLNHTLLAYHTLLAAYRTPLKALLIVSGESWWVSDTGELKKAVWHAVRVLEHAIDDPELGCNQDSNIPNSGLCNCFACLNAREDCSVPVMPEGHCPHVPFPAPVYPEATATLTTANGAKAITSLHANWVLYICGLICWAYVMDNITPATDDSALPPVFLKSYISIFTLLAPSWSQISRSSIPDHTRRNTSGLLEYIRTRWLQASGGLLNEGEMVVRRLTEQRKSK
ncbi:uncharacterized protein PADG_01482 [Paracoccidioides brasiliensis Pb18]|uniref:C2H2-type domain-containing protein n=1 Tax=Paracoccidioides brasiliensis (strain Pb18) TaxID=502780 RepID=C1G3G6_PARBD|nr:uncharacterized protein PADG_01482 [Paracoccidioides brasiliensis Pb18]EEH45332.2 hypothetical protein PADG_01482 [Paracoccidioides brasiliensis Pb18]